MKGDKSRSVGMATINLAEYLDRDKYTDVNVKLEKCPDPDACFKFTLSKTLINVTTGSENMSMADGAFGADAMSMDSGPESTFKFADLDKQNTLELDKPKLKSKHTLPIPRPKSQFQQKAVEEPIKEEDKDSYKNESDAESEQKSKPLLKLNINKLAVLKRGHTTIGAAGGAALENGTAQQQIKLKLLKNTENNNHHTAD